VRASPARETKPRHAQLTGVPSQALRLLQYLQNGVELCSLIRALLPPTSAIAKRCRFVANAQPGTFLARDNVINFLTAAKSLGVSGAPACCRLARVHYALTPPLPACARAELSLFDPEDLVTLRAPKAVMSCLLNLARVMADVYGISPPPMVALEIQLDRELAEAGEGTPLRRCKGRQFASRAALQQARTSLKPGRETLP
jgi:hypothetical protein